MCRWYVIQAMHPFDGLKKAGFEIDLVSETGTYQPDALSLTKDWLSEEDLKRYNDPNEEFRSKLDKLKSPKDVKAKDVSYRAYPLPRLVLGHHIDKTCLSALVRSLLRLGRSRIPDRLP
jgi:putative intracellular protease/amidase